jgi:predicted O-methyltransferase YrrM
VRPELAAQLDALHRAGREHDARQSERKDTLRNLEPATAELLSVLVRATGARRVLELGTSNGYSTLWLAEAVAATGGRLCSVDVDPGRTAAALENLSRAGLDAHVELRTEDAGDVLAQAAPAAWDLVFLDAERPAYAGYWPHLLRALRPGGLLVVDNVLSHAEQVADLRALVAAEPAVRACVVPIGAGALLVVRDP